MTTNAVDWIRDAEQAGTELRAAIREAHELTADLRAMLKEWRAEVAAVPDRVSALFDGLMANEVKSGLQRYEDSINNAIKTTEAAIDKRFQTIADILTGEDKASQRRGDPSLLEYARRKAQP
jgi:hypothetical protein